ncbi:Flp pilus assembly protein CpaB [Rhizobium beringeri]
MKPARLIILAVAVVAAGLAGLLAMRMAGSGGVVTQVRSVVEKEPTVNVLVSSANLPVGARLDDKLVHWMAWPQGGVVPGLITEADKPDAIRICRAPSCVCRSSKANPSGRKKVADPSSRILSSLLPAGKRAVATEISVATGAGGFILPNDQRRCHHGPQGYRGRQAHYRNRAEQCPRSRHRPADTGKGRRLEIGGRHDRDARAHP